MKTLALFTSVLFATACGDNYNPSNPDANEVDAPTVDAPAVDSPPGWTPPTAQSLQISATQPDVIMSAAAGPNGSFYAAGYLDTDIGGGTIERRIIVFKLGSSGVPDATFGTSGKADTGFVFRGGTDDIDIATLSNGDIIVSATVAAEVANGADASDTDIGLIKLSATNGAVVTAWGTNGLVRHSFNTSLTSANRDAARGLAIGTGDTIYVTGAGRGPGNQQPGNTEARIDLDFYVVKLAATGTIANDWGDGDSGQRAIDLFLPAFGTITPNVHAGATVRGVIALADGSVIAGGYARNTLTLSPQPVLFKLDANGDLATGFADGGIFHSTVLGGQTEVYNFALHGDKVVTGGYGREAATGPNDWISMRFNVSDGARDMTWGNATLGKNLFDVDPSIQDEGSNCFSAIALPNGKTLLIGSTGTAASGQPPSATQDAAFAVLAADGTRDIAYGTGLAKYKLSSTDDGADQFWGAAVSGDKVLIVGWRGATIANPQTAENNDNSYAVLLDIE
ncbi:MAG: hypothetical protein ACKV2T_20085 [Kofleriaceae bacterium]